LSALRRLPLVICVDNTGETSFELVMPIVMSAFNDGFLVRPVHSLHPFIQASP
jgi:hypothetical protein